ncbi:serine/threonine-protein kinase GRIK1-like isoform X1 [Pistacia vera]|uniref:serine/threonine-protein kinase GRIK1-like isoform X1 n=1 Tax=Pistacia vera TaxID=55513 RepID=UPI001263328C|nr:serine/threonine-protein kinase GRIK1-like isoform X1 [Pistacia vera]
MSGFLCSKLDEKMSLSNSFTVHESSIIQPWWLFKPFYQNYCLDNDDDEERDISKKKGAPLTPYMSRESLFTCKKIPPKETSSLNFAVHMNGKKMINEYVKVRKISRGSYGKVALYLNINNGTPFAIKTVCKSRLRKMRVTQSETAMANVRREVSIMKMLDHPNVVNLIEVIDDKKADYLYMVLEYVEGETISEISRKTGPIDESTARSYFKDIIAGVIYLHSHNIIHGDMKPENLLVTRSGRVKICDFSSSHAFEGANDELRRFPGTVAVTAPECYLDAFYHGKAADIWAVGVTFYYIVTGQLPFLGESIPETYEKILNSPLSLPEEIDPELKDLLQRLLCKDPIQRITSDVAAEHPWVVKEGGLVPRKSSCSCRLSCLLAKRHQNGNQQYI